MGLRLITVLVALVFFIQPAGHAQPANLLRLRTIVQEKQAKKGFANDTAYIDALNNLAYAYYRISAESNALRQLGNGYRLTGDYTNTLYNYQQALAVAEKINDHNLIAKASINISLIYVDMGKLDEAFVLAERSRRLFEETGDSMNLSKSLTCIGGIWHIRKQYEKALQYRWQALALARTMKNEYLVATGNDDIAGTLLAQGHYEEALARCLQSYEYFSHSDDKIRLSVAATMVARSDFRLKRYTEALKYALEGVQAATAVKGKPEMRDAYRITAEVYEAKGDYANALKYFRNFSNFSDTLINEQMQKNTARLEARYEYAKIENRLKEEQAKKDAQHQAIVRNKEFEISFFITVIVFLSTFAFLLFRSRAAKQKINQVLEAKNTEISRQKEEIETQSLQLLLNNQQKDKLFSIISHDLKAPLQSLTMVLDLLKARLLSEAEINKMIEELRRDVDFSAGLVRNLLFWANSQLDGIVARPVVLDLRQLVNEVFDLFIKQASDKTIVLRNQVAPGLQSHADKDMLHVVTRNLVSNAVKFCRPGDTITIESKMAGADIGICVADTGIGIKEGLLEKINEKKIVTTFGTANEKGTGLGLLLCREFVELNNGLFSIESKWGEGSRFFFTLPAYPAKKDPGNP